MKGEDMKKYITGIRFMKDFSLTENSTVCSIDTLLCRILKEGAQEVTVVPEHLTSFSFSPESITPEQLANCLRALADKIQELQD